MEKRNITQVPLCAGPAPDARGPTQGDLPHTRRLRPHVHGRGARRGTAAHGLRQRGPGAKCEGRGGTQGRKRTSGEGASRQTSARGHAQGREGAARTLLQEEQQKPVPRPARTDTDPGEAGEGRGQGRRGSQGRQGRGKGRETGRAQGCPESQVRAEGEGEGGPRRGG